MLPEEEQDPKTTTDEHDPPVEENADPQVDTTAPAVDDNSPEAGIEALKRQLADYEARQKDFERLRDQERQTLQQERAAREEAERRAGMAQRDAATQHRERAEAQYDAVVNALAAAEGNMTHRQAELAAAMQEGDFAKVGVLSAEIGKIAARIQRFEEGKAEFELRSKQEPAAPPAPPVPRQQTEAEVRESWINNLPYRSAQWVRSHQDRYWGDERFRAMVAGAHQVAVGRGIAQDSDDYFKYIEEQVGLRSGESTSQSTTPPPVTELPKAPLPTSAAGQTQGRRTPQPSAPPAGSTQTSQRTDSAQTSVSLTQEEREFCRLNDIPEANYAKQKADLLRERRIGPNAIH